MSAAIVATAALSAAWGAWSPAQASACSCIRPPPPPAARDGATSVFEGRVLSTTDRSDGVVVTFEVVRTWKGADAERLDIRTANNSAACGFHFEVGRSYLVYTGTIEGVETASLCSRTTAIEEAAEDIAALGEGVTPVDPTGGTAFEEPSQTSPAAGGCAHCAVGGRSSGWPRGLAAVTLVLMLLIVRRRHAAR